MSFKSFKKIISIITIATFIATNAIYAAPDSKSIFKNKKVNYQKISDKNDGVMRQKKAVISGEDVKQAESQEKEAKKILSSHLEDISQIHIPQELGRITEVYNNADSKDKKSNLIVHIQDLHTNPEAELNLAKILELLLKDYNMGLVCSEGADGKVDTSLVSSFPDSQAKEKVSRIFIDSGELTGEEYLSITKYPNLPIWGIEDEKIYFQNIADFNNIMKFKTSSQVFISQAKKALEQLRPKIYSKEMMSLDQKESDYENKKIETEAYLKYLSAYIQKFNLPTADYKNISLLTETMVKEKTIDQLKIMKDYQNLFLNLQSTLQSRSLNNDLDSLIAMANLFKDQKISPFSFYSYLKDLANKYLKEGFAAKYPELDSFVDYLAKVNLLDSTKLFVEMENLSYDIKTNLARNAEEKTLVSGLRNIKFLESFFNLKVSNEELDYYLNNKDSHKVAFFEKFLKPAVAKYNISTIIGYNPDLIDKHFQELEDFYKVVKDRDVAMVNKSISEIEKRNSRVSVLIAGGFHTKGITRFLRERGYSYIVVSPYSKTDIDEENYHFLLSGKRKPLAEILSKLDVSDMFKRYVKTLRVPLMFSGLAEKLEAYLGVDSGTAISIRDRLVAALQIGFGGGSVELKKSAEDILVARYTPEKGSPQYYKIATERVTAARPADFTGDTVYTETQHGQTAVAIGDAVLALSPEQRIEIANAYEKLISRKEEIIPKGKDDGRGNLEYVFTNLKTNMLQMLVSFESRVSFSSLSLDDFKHVIRSEQVRKNLEKNAKKGFAITIVAGAPFGEGRSDFEELVDKIRVRIREITGGKVSFNQDSGITALHMTLQAVTRTKNFEEDDVDSMNEALQQVKNTVGEINKVLKGDVAGSIAGIASRSNPFQVKLIGLGYYYKAGEISFYLEPVSEYVEEGGKKILNVKKELANLPTESKGEALHISLGRITEALSDKQIEEINGLFEELGIGEMKPFEIRDMKVVMYGHRSLVDVVDAQTLEFGRPDQSLEFDEFYKKTEERIASIGRGSVWGVRVNAAKNCLKFL